MKTIETDTATIHYPGCDGHIGNEINCSLCMVRVAAPELLALAKTQRSRLAYIRQLLVDIRGCDNARTRAGLLDQIWAETAKNEYESAVAKAEGR